MARRFSILLLLMLSLSSCAFDDADIADAPPDAATLPMAIDAPESHFNMPDAVGSYGPDGVAGSYLASRAALGVADFKDAAIYLNRTLERDSDNQSLIERTAVLFIMGGDVDRAVPLVKRWIENKPNSALPHLVLFLDAVRQNRFREAEDILDRMQALNVNKLTIPLLYAWTLSGEGEFDAAIEKIRPLFAHETAAGIVYLHAALIAEYSGNLQSALDYNLKAIGRFATVPLRISMNAGHVYERLAEADQARALYDAFTKRSPNNYVFDAAYARLSSGQVAPVNVRTVQDGIAQVLYDIATSFEGQSSNELAVVYSKLSAWMSGDFEFNQLLQAELYEAYQQYLPAIAIHEKLQNHPAFGWSASLRLAREYTKVGKTKQAIAILESLRTKFPKRVEVATMLGDIYRTEKDYAAAIESYTQAIENSEPVETGDWPLFYARGTAFERAKLWASAERDLKKSLELSPDQPYVLNYLAYSWVERGENLDEALAMLQRAFSLAPNDAFIIDSLGWAYFQLGRYEMAEPYLQAAVEIRPFDAQLIDHYGDVLWRLGREEQATIQWKRALSFKPEAASIDAIERKIKYGLDAAVADGKDAKTDAAESTPAVH